MIHFQHTIIKRTASGSEIISHAIGMVSEGDKGFLKKPGIWRCITAKIDP